MKYYWWPLQTGLVLISMFFLVFGVDLLMGAYSLKNPFHFIMTFFAACLIILISLTLAAGFLIRMAGVYKRLKHGSGAKSAGTEILEPEGPEQNFPEKDTTMNERPKEKS